MICPLGRKTRDDEIWPAGGYSPAAAFADPWFPRRWRMSEGPVGRRSALYRISASAATLCFRGGRPATLCFTPSERALPANRKQRSWRLGCGKVMVYSRQSYGLSQNYTEAHESAGRFHRTDAL